MRGKLAAHQSLQLLMTAHITNVHTKLQHAQTIHCWATCCIPTGKNTQRTS